MEKRKQLFAICFLCVAALCLTAAPLLILGHYNFPSADDWSFGASVHQQIQNNGSFAEVIGEIFAVVKLWRTKGEPRYANAFLGALQPGIWGEHAYRVTAWLMIGSIIVSEVLLARFLLKGREKGSLFQTLPVVLPSIIIQLLCVPFPVETFYWWTGAVNYTFIFSLSLILFILFWDLASRDKNWRHTLIQLFFGILLAIFVGGDNYATSLSMACLLVSCSAILAVKNRKALLRTLPITIVTVAGLILCLTAPGNQVRLNQEFGGTTTGAGQAILMSLYRTASNVYSWTGLKILLMILLIFPFMWKALKHLEKTFKYPLLFTLFTFGIYASQIVPTMYVDGSTGGGRMAAILYYAYHVWILINVGYWTGWIQRRQWDIPQFLRKIKAKINQYLLGWFCIVGMLLVVYMGFTEIRLTSTYRACVWLIRGYASEYANAWEERLAVLHDDTVKEVYFTPLPAPPELIFYADFKTGENWVNSACAKYYEKDYVGLTEE